MGVTSFPAFFLKMLALNDNFCCYAIRLFRWANEQNGRKCRPHNCFLIYGTMLLRNENNSCKKQGGFSHFRTEGDQPTLNRRLKFPPKVNVRTAHMPYAKVVNFLDMERFHESLDGKLVVLVRDTSLQLCLQ